MSILAMHSCFVTATGTEIGKTLVACALLWQLRNMGHAVRALKPVVSGYVDDASDNDPKLLLAAQGIISSKSEVENISPWRFSAPISPDLAAREEGMSVQFYDIVNFCRDALASGRGRVFIEGAGGVMSPLTERHTNLDLIDTLKIPAILVTGAYLGAVTHTLCAVEVLQARGITIQGIVVNAGNSDVAMLQQTQDILERFLSQGINIYLIPRLDFVEELWKYVPDITALILQ